MWRFICFAFFVSLLSVESAAEGLNNGDVCQTANGTFGTCVPVKNCSYVQKFSLRKGFSYYDTEYLDTLKCGEMKVAGRKRPVSLICCPKFENFHCKHDFSDRIHLGEVTQRGEFPWAALLFYDVGRNRTVPKCGGTLISERYVITAAHCTVDRPNWKLLYARFNEFNTSSKENCTYIEDEEICRYDYAVSDIIPHPDYDKNKNSRPNDICILQLAEKVSFNSFVRPICLPIEPEIQQLPIVDHNFTVTGWGETETAIRSELQLHVRLPALNNTACNSVYKVANVTLTEKQLCVGGLNGTDSCRGDSGGPLMREVSDIWYLIGVVSFGARVCGTKDLPGVYTNVEKYLDWIENHTFVEQYW
ncbi:AGAP009844-PA-like protein [Anopheles sinensis]|uniref:CLIP domain-containing serine protease n=1 Tax=Anopheles sinensis TaxID=74873 RepID=A0A084W8V0_ANOSI|nr:AGAP009844-PA-like protein [Anopheles sinensis]